MQVAASLRVPAPRMPCRIANQRQSMTARSRSTILAAIAPLVSSVLLVATGCGGVRAPNSDAQESRDATVDITDARAIDAAPGTADRSCTEAKARLATATDGAFLIDPDLDGPLYKPFEVFCADMATAAPKEFLELRRTSAPSDARPASNYSTYAMGKPHGVWTCDCGAATTIYTKVRIDPVKLLITGDARFGVYSNSTDRACLATMTGCPAPVPFANASACVATNTPAGSANVDLRDTPFHISGVGADVSMFKKYEDSGGPGFMSAGTAKIDAARKVLDLTGGGDCGGFGAFAGLQLAQDL